MNCEDVAMQFLVANVSGRPPLFVRSSLGDLGVVGGISTRGGHMAPSLRQPPRPPPRPSPSDHSSELLTPVRGRWSAPTASTTSTRCLREATRPSSPSGQSARSPSWPATSWSGERARGSRTSRRPGTSSSPPTCPSRSPPRSSSRSCWPRRYSASSTSAAAARCGSARRARPPPPPLLPGCPCGRARPRSGARIRPRSSPPAAPSDCT
mmetsp:Transcript_41372/g.133045  ORF Transcript_41372/g.133045 Transcript_41372/m.133045 type:complete len:209 (-) Transcript_41372:152-778(-)